MCVYDKVTDDMMRSITDYLSEKPDLKQTICTLRPMKQTVLNVTIKTNIHYYDCHRDCATMCDQLGRAGKKE